MIKIFTSKKRFTEKKYIIEYIFKSRFGLKNIEIIEKNIPNFEIALPNKFTFHLPNIFLNSDETDWLKKNSLPNLPLKNIDLSHLTHLTFLSGTQIPVLFGTKDKSLEHPVSNIDIFGFAFFMLTRYEELVEKERDLHGSFLANNAVAFKEGFLDRPLVDEYIELLWDFLYSSDPSLLRTQKEFQIIPTHDIDHHLFWPTVSFKRVLISCVSKFFFKRQFKQSIKDFIHWRASKIGHVRFLAQDPYNTYHYIMDISDKHKLTSLFYFMVDRKNKLDGSYTHEDPFIKRMVREVYVRGHEVALHQSYETMNRKSIEREIQLLRESYNVKGKIKSRHHYLRFEPSSCFKELDNSNVSEDSTLYYAEEEGFRCGTCHTFPVFDVQNRKALTLIESPLIFMETTFFSNHYKNNNEKELIINRALLLKERCKKVHGNFILLWHNSRLKNSKERKLYETIVSA